MKPHEVYLITFGEPGNLWSLVGEYAGDDAAGRCVFICGPMAPVYIPRERIIEWTPLS